ncbi:MAG: peptidoglycan DD-metalloendopeptidase family protein [Anaerolineae bacterium]|nr:peptidoglycan DD-metalloendopeptidase family protein [Anaerolineae bacterium]
MPRIRLIFCLLILALSGLTVSAQGDCRTVTSIYFPVDRTAFQLAQDFAVPSPRHQGRYHTGEDYFGGRGTSYGQPVRAIADGRVTYSAPNGWGLDKGVVIIEHTFPDGTVAYSQYGHMEQAGDYAFPARYSCVSAGDIIGVIGDIRPAPHLHFEIRSNQPDVPGPGYTWAQPTDLGWLDPSAFVINWGAWLNPAHRFHLDSSSPPLVMRDGSLIYLAGNRVRGATPDGRVLWRIGLEHPAVGLSWLPDSALLTYLDGTMQVINLDGTLGANWSTGLPLDRPPLEIGPWLVVHTADNMLVAFDSDRHITAWQMSDTAPIIASHATVSQVGIVTQTNDLLSLSPGGGLLDRRHLAGAVALGEDSAGNLLVYGAEGLFRVSTDAQWTQIAGAPPAQGSGAVLEREGRFYLFDGVRLGAYDSNLAPLWESPVNAVNGAASLTLESNILLLTVGGNINAWDASNGGLCGATQVYQERGQTLWSELGSDGLLRVSSADSITGFDWRAFIGVCTG